jgi:hypothetical protein
MKPENNQPSSASETAPETNNPKTWKRYLYTEAGVVAAFAFLITAHSWYSVGEPDSKPGFVERRLGFLEPVLGSYYAPITLTAVTVALVILAWRQGGRKRC